MKSLEIVNDRLRLFKKDKYGYAAICYMELQQIKQDLEVLEILKKYLKVICCCEDKEPNEFISLKASIDKWGGERFSNYNDDEKVVSDFNKVKQWLEDNK